MYKIAIAAVALAVFAAPALTGGAKATPLAMGVQAHVAGAQSAAPASTIVPVRHHYRHRHHSFGHGGWFRGHRFFGHRGGFRGHRSFGHGRSFHGHRSFGGGRSYYQEGLRTALRDLSVQLKMRPGSPPEQFRALVEGPAAQTLDDGEAATIAYAAEKGAVPLLDERKANRICAERFPALHRGATVDVLAHPAVMEALGSNGHREAVFNALYRGKMRVLPHHQK